MEKLISYLWRNFKYAGKTVFSKFREYLPFFVALFVIQTVFFSTFVTTATNYESQKASLSEEYDHDILISGLSYNEYIVMSEKFYYMSFMKNRPFESYEVSNVKTAAGEEWRFYILMRDGSDNEEFLKAYVYDLIGEELPGVDIIYTPLNEYRNTSEFYAKSPSLLLLVLLTLISAGAMFTLYSVRINQNRFQYGIYSAFGAGFKRLVSTSVFEMMVVSFVALPLSALFTWGVSSLIYGAVNVTTVWSVWAFVEVLIMNLAVVTAGVILPMRIVSSKTPMSLIRAEDNSNLVSSPRGTKFMRGEKFLKVYELLGMWRFRKYYLKLLASAVIFSAVFICGAYVADMNLKASVQPIEQFAINAKKSSSDIASDADLLSRHLQDADYFFDTIGAYEGVNSVEYTDEIFAADAQNIALLTDAQAYVAGTEMAGIKNTNNPFEEMKKSLGAMYEAGYRKATYGYNYSAYDKNMLSVLAERYDIEGDVYSVLENDNTIIVTEDVMNSRKYSFSVGDKIMIGKLVEAGKDLQFSDPFDTVGVTSTMISGNHYVFEEYTVGAVIKDYPDTEGYITVGVSYSEYEELTGKKAVPENITVYLDSDVTAEQYDEISRNIQEIKNRYGYDFSFIDRYGYFYRTVENEKRVFEFGILLSLLVLMISPIVWFYSQSLFYKKRSKEMYVLTAYGAGRRVLGRIHKTSALMLSVISFVFTALLGVLSSLFIFKLLNEWLAFFGFGDGVRYSFSIPPAAFALCLVISILCAFISSYLPYRKIIRGMSPSKKKNKTGNELEGIGLSDISEKEEE